MWRAGRIRRRTSVVRRVGGVLITLLIAAVAALIVWWLMRGGGPGVRVTGASVRTPVGTQRCGTTAAIVGTIRTNGGGGQISYRWRRSDGQTSGILDEQVHKGQHSLQVPFRWTVQGPGILHAVATLEVLQPNHAPVTASNAFEYNCA